MNGFGKQRLPLLALVGALSLAAGCGRQQEAPPDSGGLPNVQVLTVVAQPFTFTSDWPGRIEPLRVAQVRARVAGIVLKRQFEEGAQVKAGQVLFQIDPATFKAALSRAQGELARAEAALAEAQSVVRRYEPLVEIEAVSQQDFDAAQSTFKRAQAARQAAAADVETARLNLGYATVTAPISGRIGRAQVTEGALVGQNEGTLLATIQQIDSVYVDFNQPVADLLQMREALADGRLAGGRSAGAPISVSVEGSTQRREGRLLFSDITVERSTGQVVLRGQLDNVDGLLLPGMYVRVHVGHGTDPNAILIPQRAVLRGTDGKPQVLVIGSDGVAEARTVRTGSMRGGDWHILEGLAAGEQVVVSGKAAAGDKVQIVAAGQAAPDASPSGAAQP